jgi:hypothetical protein
MGIDAAHHRAAMSTMVAERIAVEVRKPRKARAKEGRDGAVSAVCAIMGGQRDEACSYPMKTPLTVT